MYDVWLRPQIVAWHLWLRRMGNSRLIYSYVNVKQDIQSSQGISRAVPLKGSFFGGRQFWDVPAEMDLTIRYGSHCHWNDVSFPVMVGLSTSLCQRWPEGKSSNIPDVHPIQFPFSYRFSHGFPMVTTHLSLKQSDLVMIPLNHHDSTLCQRLFTLTGSIPNRDGLLPY